MSDPVLQVRDLKKHFPLGSSLLRRSTGAVKAVDGVSFHVARNEVLGLVGESGSGKSTIGRAIVGLSPPTSGSIQFEGVDLGEALAHGRPDVRRRIQMVFQDPYGSLNPRRTAGDLVAQGLVARGVPRKIALQKARDLFSLVGLDPASTDRLPHEFSGGQRQRIGLARALALEPKILVADEAVSALDVSVQAQVLRLLADLRDRLSLSMIFITHDLRVAAQICDRIAIMQRGVVVEHGATAEIFARPQHPYTQRLFAAVPGR